MHRVAFRRSFFLLTLLFPFCAAAQTLIINEVSQGATGNQEYVEFVVVDTSVVYNCQATQPPCIDIRGWIFDDNSGYHGAAGIAAGAVRFSFDPLWACIPLGTVIVVYNGADINPLLPTEDISTSDGNCTIVASITNATLFESNATTPGAVACSYPAAGWTPGGNWNTTLLANGGDCARIVDLGGCEVFSVCWGTNNLNNLIYFAGGATAANNAANTVYYFNDGDASNQANWTIGCADVPACGTENQTPGAPNNPLNAAFIAQFNNGCTPITPLVAAASVNNNATCTCDGQATASGSGSIPGYSYQWLDAGFLPIGQTTATATNLCGGTYYAVVTSTIGCTDTAQINITSSGSLDVSVNSPTICEGANVLLTATPSAAGGTYTWSPSGSTTSTLLVSPVSTTTYEVFYQLGGCIDSAIATVTVNPAPNIGAGADLVLCLGESATLNGSGGSSYTWNNSVTNGTPFIPPLGTTNYTVTGTNANGCSSNDVVSITVNPLPVISAGADLFLCEGESATLAGSGGLSYTWDNGISNGSSFTPSLGTTNYTVTGTDANGCSASDVVSVTVNANPSANASFTPTTGNAALSVDFTNLSSGGTSYFWNFGNGQSTTTASTSNVSTIYSAGTYTISLTASNGNCQSIWSDYITVLIGDPSVIEVPNVFTPNNDFSNDLFYIYSENLASMEGSILNRWGEVMLSFSGVDFNWDGTFRGEPALEGTYFLLYRAIGLDQKEYTGQSFFQLIR